VTEPVDLNFLRWHWSSAYEISYRAGKYQAARRDDGTVLAAGSADELLELVRADYARRPVPRQRDGPPGTV
jgi:hypothetical protein